MGGRQREEAGRPLGSPGRHDRHADRAAADRLPEGLGVDFAVHNPMLLSLRSHPSKRSAELDHAVMCRSMNASMRSNMSPVLDRSGAWPTPRSMSMYSSAIEPPALR